MAAEAAQHLEEETRPAWGGGGSPFRVSYGKMMMWIFLVSDALTFGALLVSLGFARQSYAGEWPAGEEVFQAFPLLGKGLPLLYVALMTFILIVSSVTMVLAVEAGHRMDKKGVVKWLIATIIGGLFFLLSQVWEWSHFIHGKEINGEYVHATLTHNPYGPQLYADFFFFVTGFHGFHVFSGVVLNFIVLLMALKGKFEKVGHYEMVEKAGLYWHFVDLVWVFVFTFFYLI
jgi:cytochrome c oxidase subunit 3